MAAGNPIPLAAMFLALAGAAPAGDRSATAGSALFSPLRPGDPQATGAPQCAAMDSAGRILTSYGEVDAFAAMRIGGRLVRFRKAGTSASLHRFRAREGLLTIALGARIGQHEEAVSYRATLTFTDRNGRTHSAPVRLDCGA
jgi:hypothetical protein